MPLVVKVGGSLFDWPQLGPRLARWLQMSASGETLIVPGGGKFADQVRKLDEIHRLSEETSHWMALRAMTMSAGFLAELLEENGYDLDFARIETVHDCTESWARKDRPIIDAYAFCSRDELVVGALPHSWDVTSDSVAARLAELLGAEVTLLKSADPPAGNADDWAAAGYVDSFFPTIVERAKLRVRAVNLENLLMRTWAAHTNAIRGLAFSPDGSRFVTIADGDSAAIVWDRFGPVEPLRLSLFQEPALSVAFAPDGQSVALGRQSAVELWSTADNERFARLDSLRHRSKSLAFSPDGRTLLSAGERRGDWKPDFLHAVIWDLRTGRAICDHGRPTGDYRGFSFAIDATRFLWSHGTGDATSETIVPLTDVPTEVDLASLISPGPLLAGAMSPDGKTFVGAVKSQVYLWSLGIALGSEPPDSAWLSAQELRRLAGREKDALAIEASAGFVGSNERIDAVAFTPDGRRLFTGTAVGSIRLWNMPDRLSTTDAFADGPVWIEQPVMEFDWQFGPITTLAIAPDGLTAAAGGMDGRVLVWDLDS